MIEYFQNAQRFTAILPDNSFIQILVLQDVKMITRGSNTSIAGDAKTFGERIEKEVFTAVLDAAVNQLLDHKNKLEQ